MVEKMCFRLFCYEKYFEHSEEIYSWTKSMTYATFPEYFEQNKWYLKKLYKKVYINS